MNDVKAALCLVVSTFVCVIGGCADSTAPVVVKLAASPYVTVDELQSLLDGSTEVVLVEFGVEIGCYRCDELRPQIEQLAEQFAGRATVRRINLHRERPLAAQLGVAVCPTYVAFVAGREAFRTTYPTSGDLIKAQLNRVLESPNTGDSP
jgi:thioredoxin 1